MNGWKRWLPGLQILSRYEAAWLPHDLMAGLVLTTMLVPVGIAYAVASGVPGIYGLYATIVPLLAYALFGPSRILVLGPDSSLAAVILAVVLPLSGGDPMRAVAVASMMAVVSGLVCILVGVMRLGFVTELLSKPIRYGYMNGIALTVLISQLPKLFGFSIDSVGPLRDLAADRRSRCWAARPTGPRSRSAPARWRRSCCSSASKRIPGILIAVVGATVAVGVLGLDESAGVKVLGPLPQGLPSFALPWISSRRPRPSGDRRLRRRHGGVRRHQRPVAHVCGQDPLPGRSEPGDDRSGRRQPGRWTVPGVSDQQQLLAHAGRRSRGREDPAHRRGRRRGRRLAAAARTQSAGGPAQQRAGSGRDRGGHRPVRIRRPAPHLPHPALGVLAVHRLLRWRRRIRSDSRHRPGDRHRGHRISVGRLAATLRRAGPSRRHPRLPRHQALSRGAAHTRPGAVPLGRAAVLRQCRAVPPARARGRGADRRRRCGGSSWPPSRSPAST